ncbi:hypothetical protein [Planktotalea sp.]|uniref:hypothetical protein n=1 Tax=Planktotalea sp. TaxID=2029877 RepID=UPI0035C83333
MGLYPLSLLYSATEKPLGLQGDLSLNCAMNDVQLTPYTRSDHAWLVAQHQKLYQQSDGFDDSFGPLVGQILTDFESNADPSSEAG